MQSVAYDYKMLSCIQEPGLGSVQIQSVIWIKVLIEFLYLPMLGDPIISYWTYLSKGKLIILLK